MMKSVMRHQTSITREHTTAFFLSAHKGKHVPIRASTGRLLRVGDGAHRHTEEPRPHFARSHFPKKRRNRRFRKRRNHTLAPHSGPLFGTLQFRKRIKVRRELHCPRCAARSKSAARSDANSPLRTISPRSAKHRREYLPMMRWLCCPRLVKPHPTNSQFKPRRTQSPFTKDRKCRQLPLPLPLVLDRRHVPQKATNSNIEQPQMSIRQHIRLQPAVSRGLTEADEEQPPHALGHIAPPHISRLMKSTTQRGNTTPDLLRRRRRRCNLGAQVPPVLRHAPRKNRLLLHPPHLRPGPWPPQAQQKHRLVQIESIPSASQCIPKSCSAPRHIAKKLVRRLRLGLVLLPRDVVHVDRQPKILLLLRHRVHSHHQLRSLPHRPRSIPPLDLLAIVLPEGPRRPPVPHEETVAGAKRVLHSFDVHSEHTVPVVVDQVQAMPVLHVLLNDLINPIVTRAGKGIPRIEQRDDVGVSSVPCSPAQRHLYNERRDPAPALDRAVLPVPVLTRHVPAQPAEPRQPRAVKGMHQPEAVAPHLAIVLADHITARTTPSKRRPAHRANMYQKRTKTPLELRRHQCTFASITYT